MNDDLFNELVSSVREAGAIRRGEAPAARSFEPSEIDVAAIRRGYNLTQARFAALLGISERTLQKWEQGRRKPEGPARRLLQVAQAHPMALLDTLTPG